jgi:hypothetical protein
MTAFRIFHEINRSADFKLNKSIKAANAVFTYVFDPEYVTSNIMQRYPKLQRGEGERTANRGIFSEVELAADASKAALPRSLFATLDVCQPRTRQW